MSNVPDRPRPPAPPAERTLSSGDFELVIRRAAELQAREAEQGADSMSESEVIRIGRELGLSTRHLNQALVEVGGHATEESGLFVKLFGPASIRASRAVVGDAREVATRLERHLTEREYLAVLRRLPDRVLFTRATGVAAAVGRASSQIFSGVPLLNVGNLEVAVQPLEDGYSYATLATSLASERTATAAGSILGGGSAAAVVGAVAAIAVAPPAALVALPVLGGVAYGGHAYYESLIAKTQVQLEALLDRLEHNELPPPVQRRRY